MEDMTHLWDVDHAYYCNQGNFYSNECSSHFETWPEFFAEEGDSDKDMNLVFRWDWKMPGGDDDKRLPLNPDPYYRDGELLLFFIGQRKGLFRYTSVRVCQADEPAVRAWLTERWQHLRGLWEPLATATPPAAIKAQEKD